MLPFICFYFTSLAEQVNCIERMLLFKVNRQTMRQSILGVFLFYLINGCESSCYCATSCEASVRPMLPPNLPEYKAVAYINGTCTSWPVNSDEQVRIKFCRKVLLGSAFWDFTVDTYKLAGGICRGSKNYVLDNLYVSQV